MTRKQAIQLWLTKHPQAATATADSIARNVCFWLRMKVNRYDVLAVLENM